MSLCPKFWRLHVLKYLCPIVSSVYVSICATYVKIK